MSNLVTCLNPKRVVNRYTKEVIHVPCGECSACLNKRAYTLTQRLDQERYCWKYCAFLTLSYDDIHVPLLQVTDRNLFDPNPDRCHNKLGAVNFDRKDWYFEIKKYHPDELKERVRLSEDYIKMCRQHFGGLPYLCTVDVQRFIKRLRINLQRDAKSSVKNSLKLEYDKTEHTFRYFAAGEYGPSTFRPHYHLLLFFNDEFFASNFETLVRKCWKFGNIDFSFVSESNSSYVAKYLNSNSHLPLILQNKSIRPFALYSKHPAIGTLVYNSEDIRQMFLTGSTEQVLFNHKKSVFDNVPLWRSFHDQLYPRLAGFDKFDHIDRKRLYLVPAKQDYDFEEFKGYVKNSKASYIQEYLKYLGSHDGLLDNKLLRWFNVGQRIFWQSQVFKITPLMYVKILCDYLEKEPLNKLKEYYVSLEDSIQQGKLDAINTLQFDSEFFNTRKDLDLGDLELYEIEYFRSFADLDIYKFFSDDMSIRLPYQEQFLIEHTLYYKHYADEHIKIYRDSTKTKRKNDYIASEVDPFYQNIAHFHQESDDLNNNFSNTIF